MRDKKTNNDLTKSTAPTRADKKPAVDTTTATATTTTTNIHAVLKKRKRRRHDKTMSQEPDHESTDTSPETRNDRLRQDRCETRKRAPRLDTIQNAMIPTQWIQNAMISTRCSSQEKKTNNDINLSMIATTDVTAIKGLSTSSACTHYITKTKTRPPPPQ